MAIDNREALIEEARQQLQTASRLW